MRRETLAPASGSLPEWIDVEMIRSAFAFLGLHHQAQKKRADLDAANTDFGPRVRMDCRRVAAHHQEQLHQIGEQAALWGFRNPWPRVDPSVALPKNAPDLSAPPSVRREKGKV